MHEGWGGDHASVGMRKPSGEYERPIPGTRLFWTKPGNIAVFLFYDRPCIYHYFKRDKKTLAVMNLVIYFSEEHPLQETNLRGKFSSR